MKGSGEEMKQVAALSLSGIGSANCRCNRCDYEWKSKAKEAIQALTK